MSQDDPGSPTRHARHAPSMESGQLPPLGPSASGSLGIGVTAGLGLRIHRTRSMWGSHGSLHDSNHASADLSSCGSGQGPDLGLAMEAEVGTPTKRQPVSAAAVAAGRHPLLPRDVEGDRTAAEPALTGDFVMAGTTPAVGPHCPHSGGGMAVALSPFPYLENQRAMQRQHMR
ncbi:hypothetical protein GPECTOR_63g22 [Gonium pectorale]|uniref:Uncharacterized protein n=1 Tax=Gonium pectorale TaxID=33097 RepID=A0A150G4E1_GONPE|nr:hypothetical protein GPECTOR_63g22 [Gonium pectorale]|eukprot:KXZ44694.1 hypothetical protein GPECTOR_63g22 [Gonium pectorale]